MHTAYPSGQYFNRNEPKYMCCCGCMHITTGTKVIAFLMAIGVVLQAIQSVVAFVGNSAHGSVLGSGLTSFFVGGAVVICLFLGLRSERAPYLIPYLVVQVVGILACVALIIIAIIALTSTKSFAHEFFEGFSYGNTDDVEEAVRIVAIIFIVLLIVYILFQVWFFWVVFKCYIFFRDQAMYAHKTVVDYTANG